MSPITPFNLGESALQVQAKRTTVFESVEGESLPHADQSGSSIEGEANVSFNDYIEWHDQEGTPTPIARPIFTTPIKHLLINTATASAYNSHLPLAEVAKLADVKALKQSLRRHFQSDGYNHRIAHVKLFLTKRSKENILNWGIDFFNWDEDDFGDIIFSNEAVFNCGELSGTIWVTHKAGEEYDEDCLIPKFKKCTTVMVTTYLLVRYSDSPESS
ncbi:hypothetical protein HOY82DRAFT_596617 [Tuber indicum]|nr:hypothetical protein HOY82DRAFT_596617 [Tuber indicum]